MACPATRWSKREDRGAGGGARGRRRRSGGRRRQRPADAVSSSPRRGGDKPPGCQRETPRNPGRAGRGRKRDCVGGRGSRRCPSALERNRPPCGLARAPAPPSRVRLARERSAFPGPGAAPECARYCRRPVRSGAEGDRRDRRRGIGANARKRAQFGLLARKSSAPAGDFLGAGMQVPRSRIIAEARERAHDGFDWGGWPGPRPAAISR